MTADGTENVSLSDPDCPKFKNQVFDDIKRSCLSEGTLWTDPEFAPGDVSLWGDNRPLISGVGWTRARDICEGARLFVEGSSVDDVKQGLVGDCWLAASVACIANKEHLVGKVVPHSKRQELDQDGYCGVLLFKFYKQGDWTEVVIDDYLPTKQGRLVFMRSSEPAEFWAALLEKAYAKMSGSYVSLAGGRTSAALSDLTGGLSQTIEFSEISLLSADTTRLYQKLEKALCGGGVVCLGIDHDQLPGTGSVREVRRENGLFAGHAYSLLRCFELPAGLSGPDSETTLLVKVRNPWGEAEWTGRWGDSCKMWSAVSAEDKAALNFTNQDDGEFWMEFQDLLENFSNMTICRMVARH